MKIDRCGCDIVLENDASSAQKEGLPRRMEAQINKLKLESNGKLALLSMGEHVSPFFRRPAAKHGSWQSAVI